MSDRGEPHAALREYLKYVPVRFAHDVEYATQIFVGDLLVKEVTHAVDEDPSGSPPAKR